MKYQTFTMAGILGLAGVAHFVQPAKFDSIVPPSLGNPRFWTYASGVAEIACAGMVLAPRTRRLGGLATTALMLGVYPANIYTVKKHWNNPRGRALALARLPLQIPLIKMSWTIASGAES